MAKPLKILEWDGICQPRYATAKHDGNWITLAKQEGKLQALSSLPTDITEKVQDFCWFHAVDRALTDGQELWCEAIAPTGFASDVKSWLDGTRLIVFAAPFLGDVSQEGLGLWCEKKGLNSPAYVELGEGNQWDREALLECAAELKVEGWVLKDHQCFGPWHKVKAILTLDLKVIGFVPGKGKNAGLVGSLIVADAGGNEVASVGGFTDDERYEIDEELDLGRIVEVAYQLVGSGGRLRHPRFIRWRDDKTLADRIPDNAPTREPQEDSAEY